MVRALEDVENALVALSSERQRSQSLQIAAASAEAALGRAQSLYDRGQIDLLPLLDAQRSRLSVRLSANDSSTQLLLDSVQLYKALGGGWQVFEPRQPKRDPPPPAPPARFPETRRLSRGTALKNSLAAAVALAVAAMLSACSPDKPPVEAPRPVRTAEIRYDHAREANRYVGTVQSRHEVDQAFRVGGKVAQRKVDVGQFVREGDVLAVLDDADYRLAEEAARQQHGRPPSPRRARPTRTGSAWAT